MASNVVPIRRGVRVPKKNRTADLDAIQLAQMATKARARAYEMAQTEPGSVRHLMVEAMTDIDRALPRNKLRCIISTLDEQRDFELRYAEAQLARAEHDLASRQIDRLKVFEGDVAWYDSPTLRPLVNENNVRWDNYRQAVLTLAETPAHTKYQAEQKRRQIGKVWLTAKGEFYDRLRAGVDADEERLGIGRKAKTSNKGGR